MQSLEMDWKIGNFDLTFFFFSLQLCVWWIGEKSGIYLLVLEVAFNESISEAKGGMDRNNKPLIYAFALLDKTLICVKK